MNGDEVMGRQLTRLQMACHPQIGRLVSLPPMVSAARPFQPVDVAFLPSGLPVLAMLALGQRRDFALIGIVVWIVLVSIMLLANGSPALMYRVSRSR
jgi:hypothetical protein